MNPFDLSFVLLLLISSFEIAAFGPLFKAARKCNATIVCGSEDLEDSPICGTDGRTYDTSCDLKRANCQGKRVKVYHKGPCSNVEKCALDRSFQMALFIDDDEVFVPKCNETDGSYQQVQCHESTGYCWCIQKDGRPIPQSSSVNDVPDCDLFMAKPGRRSSHRRSNSHKTSKSCTNGDRAAFNNNLLKLFVKERNRLPEDQRLPRPGNLTEEKVAAHWKFDQLDEDEDGRISKAEIDGLTRIIQNYVKPAACAKQFPDVCDADRNREIDRKEWISCLGNQFSKVAIHHVTASYRIFHGLRLGRRRPQLRNLASSTFNLLRNGSLPLLSLVFVVVALVRLRSRFLSSFRALNSYRCWFCRRFFLPSLYFCAEISVCKPFFVICEGEGGVERSLL